MKTKPWYERLFEKMIRRKPEGTKGTQRTQERDMLDHLNEELGAEMPPELAGKMPALQPERGPINEDANDRALVDANDDNPLYRAIMDEAYTQAAGWMAQAMQRDLAGDTVKEYLHRAAGVRDFIGTIEERRIELRRQRAKAQIREAAIAEAKAKRKQQPKPEKQAVYL